MTNIIVVGANQGIGLDMVKYLLSQNAMYNVIALSRNTHNLKKLNGTCNNLHLLKCDIGDTQELNATIATITKSYSQIDILINNAGILLNKPFEKCTRSEIDQVYNINVYAPMRIIQGLLPLLALSSNAHVVNISSMGGFQGSAKFPGLSIYSSSKAALASLTECLAAEYGNTTIKFNALCLGAVNTDMLRAAFPDYEAKITSVQMAEYIIQFAISGHFVQNGKVIALSLSTP